MTDDDDKKVKELIDAATRAELEKWFGLPSFQQVEEEQTAEPVKEDPEMVAVRERRAKALEAVDPAMVEAHRRRMEAPESLIKFRPDLEVRVDPSCALLDVSMVERGNIAEPRDYEPDETLKDDLKECTPQAILRDLHRPELDFEKLFEVHDYSTEGRVDAVAIVDELMTTSWKMVPLTSIFHEGVAVLRELRADRLADASAFLPTLPNRRVTE